MVSSSLVKLETSHTVILLPTVSVLWTVEMLPCICCIIFWVVINTAAYHSRPIQPSFKELHGLCNKHSSTALRTRTPALQHQNNQHHFTPALHHLNNQHHCTPALHHCSLDWNPSNWWHVLKLFKPLFKHFKRNIIFNVSTPIKTIALAKTRSDQTQYRDNIFSLNAIDYLALKNQQIVSSFCKLMIRLNEYRQVQVHMHFAVR